MSYDLGIAGDGPLDLELAEARLRAAGADGEGDELVLLRGSVVASVLLDPDEIGVGVTLSGDGDDAREGFAAVLDVVLDLADDLGARVEDPQVGRELTRADRDEALEAFG